MYLPKHFEATDSETLASLIRAHPLGTLVAQTAAGLVANHVPFELDAAAHGHGVLRAHIARANPLWQSGAAGGEVLVVFQGPEAYITPSWYPTKQQTGKVVPTWAYAVAHCYGPITFVHDAVWLRGLVDRLTTQHEAARSEPWAVSDAPADYVQKILGAIVGLEIPISRALCKLKLGQNKTEADRAGVLQGLRERGDAAIAAMAEAAEAVRRP